MRTFLIHTIVAFVAAYLFFKNTDLITYNAATAIAVFLILFAILWLSSPLYSKSYFSKLPKALGFLFFFIKEVFVANLRIAYDIITPRYHMQPTIIELPLDAESDLEITLLACMITLTPGTLSLDVREDRKVLYIHALYLDEGGVAQLKHSLKHGFERRLLELTA